MPALATELEARGHGPLLREKRGREAPRRPCPIGQRVRLIQIKLASGGLHADMRARIKGVAWALTTHGPRRQARRARCVAPTLLRPTKSKFVPVYRLPRYSAVSSQAPVG